MNPIASFVMARAPLLPSVAPGRSNPARPSTYRACFDATQTQASRRLVECACSGQKGCRWRAPLLLLPVALASRMGCFRSQDVAGLSTLTCGTAVNDGKTTCKSLTGVSQVEAARTSSRRPCSTVGNRRALARHAAGARRVRERGGARARGGAPTRRPVGRPPKDRKARHGEP